jgi:hypothetical protein
MEYAPQTLHGTSQKRAIKPYKRGRFWGWFEAKPWLYMAVCVNSCGMPDANPLHALHKLQALPMGLWERQARAGQPSGEKALFRIP